MATSEFAQSPEKKPPSLSMPEIFDWGDVEQIHLSGLEDEDTEEVETRSYQQDTSLEQSAEQSSTGQARYSKSPSPTKEPSAQQKEHKFWPFKFRKRGEQYLVESKSPTGKSKSLSPSPSPQSHKSSPSSRSSWSPGAVVQNVAAKFSQKPDSTSTEVKYPPSFNLATITHLDGIPQEVSTVNKNQ